ncbi:pentatricopeptide repeat-containing protein [Quercus suber]|uniref:Pentatricopeptide repeat-containing protein n=1 Tax=Quercus suber TaxID=58331 RepID=A0AAW0LXV5_QUESU
MGCFARACRVHGDMNLVKLAAKKFFGLEPENPGKYVVLSNAYATYGFWKNAAEVRDVMWESGIIKEPSYSRIEVQNGSQFFFKDQRNDLYFKGCRFSWAQKRQDAAFLPGITQLRF